MDSEDTSDIQFDDLSSNNESPYSILGIDETTTDLKIIKEKYKKFLFENHPDKRNNAHNDIMYDGNNVSIEQFSKITTAFKEIINDSKHSKYKDNNNTNVHCSQSQEPQSQQKEDMLGDLWKTISTNENVKSFTDDALKSFSDNFVKSKQKKTDDITHTLAVSLEEIFNRLVRKISVKIKRRCEDCNATGMIVKGCIQCMLCQGTGRCTSNEDVSVVKVSKDEQPFVCPNCDGSGYTFMETPCKIICENCNGKKWYIVKKTLFVPCYSETVVFEKEADDCISDNGVERGDIIINVKPKTHNKFQIQNTYDLNTSKTISLIDVFKGKEITLKHLDKNDIKLQLPKNNKGFDLDQNYFNYKIRGQGLWMNTNQRGDLYVKLCIQIPKLSLTDISEIKKIISKK